MGCDFDGDESGGRAECLRIPNGSNQLWNLGCRLLDPNLLPVDCMTIIITVYMAIVQTAAVSSVSYTLSLLLPEQQAIILQ